MGFASSATVRVARRARKVDVIALRLSCAVPVGVKVIVSSPAQWRLTAAVVMLGFVLAGCQRTIGHEFDPGTAQRLQPGVSTFVQACELLGPPYRTRMVLGGSRVRTWWYLRDTPSGTVAKSVRVMFNADDLMVRLVDSVENDPTAAKP